MICPMENVSEITNAYGTFKGSFNLVENNQAPWLIFLHGFPDDTTVWSYQWDALKAAHNIWCPVLYDHAFTDQINGVADFISTLPKDKKIILIGHDMGGPVACEIARKFPDAIEKVLLINTLSLGQFISRWKEPRQWMKSSYMPLFIGPLHSARWLKMFSAKFLNKTYDLGGVKKDDPLRKHTADSLDGIKRYREALKTVPSYLASSVKKLKIETHFLFGENDPFIMVPDDHELTKHFEHFTLTILPAGHWPQRTHIEEVNQWIQRKSSNG
jgi:pimeloyl-ACP methyl ester carboxylesterase